MQQLNVGHGHDELDARSCAILEDFGRHVCQDLMDTMQDRIKDKCNELAKAVKKGKFDDWCAHASSDIWEMKRVIRESELLRDDIRGCLVAWLERKEQESSNAEMTATSAVDYPVIGLTTGVK